LRNYRTAPTYCEEQVFQWGIGNPAFLATLAWPLEKHQLSVFAPQQQWTLQGDYVLGNVSTNRTDMGSEIAWLDPETDRPASWNDYHHLNLLIPAASTITWEVTLPAALNQATLTTALKAASSTNEGLESAGLQIRIETQHESPRSLYSQTLRPDQTKWQNISIPLAEFAGQTIKLIFEIESADNKPASAILRYPVINLNLDSVAPPMQDPAIAPSNTDLSPDFISPTPQDIILDTNTPDHWTVSGADPVQGLEQTWIIAADPAFTYNPQLDICIKDFEKFYMRLGVSEDIIPRAAQVFYRLDHQTDMETWQSFWIPLLADSSVHSYSYDLKLLSLPPDARISGIRLDPVTGSIPNGKNMVKFEGIGFLHMPNSKHNNCSDLR
jgi:hypothetical protein